MKINKKFQQIVFTFLMALSMSFIISFVVVSINFGYSDIFLKTWIVIWCEAFVIAFPSAYILPRGIKRIMNTITFVESNSNNKISS
jgi:hypothetical protein